MAAKWPVLAGLGFTGFGLALHALVAASGAGVHPAELWGIPIAGAWLAVLLRVGQQQLGYGAPARPWLFLLVTVLVGKVLEKLIWVLLTLALGYYLRRFGAANAALAIQALSLAAPLVLSVVALVALASGGRGTAPAAEGWPGWHIAGQWLATLCGLNWATLALAGCLAGTGLGDWAAPFVHMLYGAMMPAAIALYCASPKTLRHGPTVRMLGLGVATNVCAGCVALVALWAVDGRVPVLSLAEDSMLPGVFGLVVWTGSGALMLWLLRRWQRPAA